MKKPIKYLIFAKDIFLGVEELGNYDFSPTKVNRIDKTAMELSKFTMAILVRKARRDGEPKPDDQEGYHIEYAKQIKKDQ